MAKTIWGNTTVLKSLLVKMNRVIRWKATDRLLVSWKGAKSVKARPKQGAGWTIHPVGDNSPGGTEQGRSSRGGAVSLREQVCTRSARHVAGVLVRVVLVSWSLDHAGGVVRGCRC